MSEKNVIYCIPGLGLDHRLFDKLNIPNAEIFFLDWIEPKKNESIKQYAKRLAKSIKHDNIFLLGVSLGGIMAIEISQFMQVCKLYLVSTVKNVSEKPSYMSWMEKLPKDNTTATKFAIEASLALKPFYDKADKAGNKLFHKMVKSANIHFINWGIREIAKWNFNNLIKTPFLHLHGTEDLIFPIKGIDMAFTVKGGTHFMIYNDAKKVSQLIESDLLSLKR